MVDRGQYVDVVEQALLSNWFGVLGQFPDDPDHPETRILYRDNSSCKGQVRLEEVITRFGQVGRRSGAVLGTGAEPHTFSAQPVPAARTGLLAAGVLRLPRFELTAICLLLRSSAVGRHQLRNQHSLV